MAGKLRGEGAKLFFRDRDDGCWGTVTIVLLVCLFFPILSLVGAVQVMVAAR